MLKFYKLLGNLFDMSWWAEVIGEKLGLYKWARNSKFRKWQEGLTGWKFWTWQLIGGISFIVVIEFILNLVGMTMLPWR